MKRRPSSATVIACVALFFSLAGTGFAVSAQLTRDVRADHSLVVIQHDLRRLKSDFETAPSIATPYGWALDAQAQNEYAICLDTQRHPRNVAAYCQRWDRP